MLPQQSIQGPQALEADRGHEFQGRNQAVLIRAELGDEAAAGLGLFHQWQGEGEVPGWGRGGFEGLTGGADHKNTALVVDYKVVDRATELGNRGQLGELPALWVEG